MDNKNFNIELLYFGHGNSNSTTVTNYHCHPYFQLEYCKSGQLTALNNNKSIILNSGDFWLIPAGTMHKFKYGYSNLDYISLKFTTSLSLSSKIINDPVCQYYLEQIYSIIDGNTPFSPYSNESKEIIENLLSGILQHLLKNNVALVSSQFLIDLQCYIYEHGATSNINDLAEQFNLSRAEFRYRFFQETGNGKIKEYIDNYILHIAEQHMRYSDIPLNKIAEQMNFSSIYAFSRYYKHHRGITPSEFRNSDKNIITV